MQIVDKSFFNNQNYIHIPLAVVDPSATPNNATELDYLCTKLEKEILLNALGSSLYNEIKAITDIDSADAKFKKLIQGDEYDGKIWLGLDNDDSLIANYIYHQFVTQTDIRLSATGAKKSKCRKRNHSNTKILNCRSASKFHKTISRGVFNYSLYRW